MYRTGDLAVVRGGKLVVKGRADGQLKLSGVRMHLSDVERAIRQRPQFRECEQLHAVAVRSPPQLGFKKPVVVVLYVAPRDDCEEAAGALDLSPPQCELELCATLYANGHMPRVPLLFCRLPALPLQAHTGKLDRLALRRRAERCVEQNADLMARAVRLEQTEREHYGGQFAPVERDVYAALYESLEAFLVLGPAHRFGDVGFDSLALTGLMTQLQRRGYSVDLDTLQVYGVATIGDLIAVCAKRSPIPNASEFEFETLRPEHLERVLDIFGDTFEKDVELHTHIGLKAADLRRFLRDVLFAHFLQSGCSLVVRDRATDAVVAAALALDVDEFAKSAQRDGARIDSLVASLSRPMRVVCALLSHADAQFEQFVHSAHMPTSRWLEITVLCVERRVVESDPAASLTLTYWAEKECLRRARLHAFSGVKSLNVSPVTIVRSLSSFFSRTQFFDPVT